MARRAETYEDAPRDAPRDAPHPKARAPEVWGYGLVAKDGGYLAARISSHGTVEYLGPKRSDGEYRTETRALALSRTFAAFQAAYAPRSPLRFGA